MDKKLAAECQVWFRKGIQWFEQFRTQDHGDFQMDGEHEVRVSEEDEQSELEDWAVDSQAGDISLVKLPIGRVGAIHHNSL